MEQKKRKAIVVAQIGRGNYIETTYGKVYETENKLCINSNEVYSSGYSFGAVCEQLRNELKGKIEDEIEVLLIGTESSYWGDLCAYYQYGKIDLTDEKKLENIRCDLEQDSRWNIQCQVEEVEINKKKIVNLGILNMRSQYADVEKFLNSCQSTKQEKIHFLIEVVEHGVVDGQIEKNFTKLRKRMETIVADVNRRGFSELDLCFDISMGYRSLPMYVYNFANYFTRLRNEERYHLHVYYGMEAIREKNYIENGERYRPLVNLHKIEELTRWINVVNEFKEYGSVRGLVKMLESADEEGVDEDIKRDRTHLAEVFAKFDYATNANNLKLLEDSIQSIIFIGENYDGTESLLDGFEEPFQYKIHKLEFSKEAQLLLEKISEDFRNRFGNAPKRCRYGYLTIKMAEWFYDQGRIGNAAIAVQEGIITYIFEQYSERFMVNPESWRIYNIRETVKEKLLAFSKEENCFEKLKYIKDNLRNVNSHIIYNDDIDMAIIESGKEKLWYLIEYMIREFKESTKPSQIEEKYLEEWFEELIPEYFTTGELKEYLECALVIARKNAEYLEAKQKEIKKAKEEKHKPKIQSSLLDYVSENGNETEKNMCEDYKRYREKNNQSVKINSIDSVFEEKRKVGDICDKTKGIIEYILNLMESENESDLKDRAKREYKNKNYEAVLECILPYIIGKNVKLYWDAIRHKKE